MNPWLLAGFLTMALLGGFSVGWWMLSRRGIRSPNAWVTTLVLLATSLGGPALTYHVIGATTTAYGVAVFVAGFGAGATFWPMAMPQGEREWL